MTYSQYWYRPLELKADQFSAFAEDVRKVFALVPSEVAVATITPDSVKIGSQHRGWDKLPDADSFLRGIAERLSPDVREMMLRYDHSGGDLIIISRVLGSVPSWNEPDFRGWYWGGAGTRHSSYDIVVCAVLALLRHHFPNDSKVDSDGGYRDWQPGLALVRWATGKDIPVPFYRHQFGLARILFSLPFHDLKQWNAMSEDEQREFREFALQWHLENLSKAFPLWSAVVAKAIDATDIPLAGPDGTGLPVITPTRVAFNGVGTDGFDPFDLRIDDADISGHRLCTMGKSGKRYDEIVTAVLTLLAHYFPGESTTWNESSLTRCNIISDGTLEDWQPGITLAERVAGHQIDVALESFEEYR